MYLITYYTENPLLDNGGAYSQCAHRSPVEFLEEVEERSEHSKVFIINTHRISGEEVERLEKIDAVD